MHLRALEIFCDVVSRRSFSQAARENGMSQSAVSQTVHQLETELGVQLLDRSKRPFVVTAEGKVYYDGCRKLLRRWRALIDDVRTLHEEVSGRVHVASIYSVGLSHINTVVQRFMMRYPKANVRVEYQHPDRVYRLVEDDRVDIGLVSYPRASRQIKITPWREETMVAVLAPNHPLVASPWIQASDLEGRAMVGFDRDLRIRQEIDRELAARDIHVDIVMEFDNIETIKRAVEINAGLSLLPAPTVVREVAAGSLVARPLANLSLTRPLGMIRRAGGTLSATARRFVQFLSEQSQVASIPGLETASVLSSRAGRPTSGVLE